MRRFPRIDKNGYYKGFKDLNGREKPEFVLKDYNTLGRKASEGFDPPQDWNELFPSDCVDGPLPEQREGYAARWTGSEWIYEEK